MLAGLCPCLAEVLKRSRKTSREKFNAEIRDSQVRILGQFVARVAYGDLECFEVGDYEADPSTSAITVAVFNEVQGCLVASTTKRYTKWHTKQKSAPRGASLLA